MDKKYLKEHGLLKSYEKYRRLCEYTTFGSDDVTNEDNDSDNADDNSNEQMPNLDSDMGSLNDASDLNNDTEGANNGNDASNLQNKPDNDGVEGLDVNNLNNDDNSGSEQSEDIESNGDEVIDVDDLTKSQEDTEKKVDDLDDKFERLMKAIDSFDSLIDKNNEKIESLKAEIERRNPTQIEKMSMQTQNSYPFNVTPNQYWSEKEQTSNYRTDNDENGVNQGQYVITKNDIDGDVDWKSISDSLDDDDVHQNLKAIFNNY